MFIRTLLVEDLEISVIAFMELFIELIVAKGFSVIDLIMLLLTLSVIFLGRPALGKVFNSPRSLCFFIVFDMQDFEAPKSSKSYRKISQKKNT